MLNYNYNLNYNYMLNYNYNYQNLPELPQRARNILVTAVRSFSMADRALLNPNICFYLKYSRSASLWQWSFPSSRLISVYFLKRRTEIYTPFIIWLSEPNRYPDQSAEVKE